MGRVGSRKRYLCTRDVVSNVCAINRAGERRRSSSSLPRLTFFTDGLGSTSFLSQLLTDVPCTSYKYPRIFACTSLSADSCFLFHVHVCHVTSVLLRPSLFYLLISLSCPPSTHTPHPSAPVRLCISSCLCFLSAARGVPNRARDQDMTQVDLESALPQTTVMVVSVTGSTTSGQPLSEQALQECLKVGMIWE